MSRASYATQLANADRAIRTNSPQPDVATKQINLLTYVHLRNIYRSTGAGRTARQIVEHLARRNDIDMRVLADASDATRVLPLVGEPWENYQYHYFRHETSRQQAQWFLTNRPVAESFWPEAEIVFCTAESYIPVHNARLVVTAHDASYFEEGAHNRDTSYWRQRFKWQLLYKKLDRTVDMFHTVSHFSAERLAHYFPTIASRIRCIHNGVTPHFFEAMPEEGSAFLDASGLIDRPFILVPGGLHYRKNAELILAASASLLKAEKDLVIVVVNHCDPAYATQAGSLGERFRLFGFVSDAELHTLYSAAQIVWFPSRYEGFGLPVVEAMACGTAVVASDSSSIPEIAGKAAALVDPADPRAHARMINDLLHDDRSRQQLEVAGRERAKKFTWDRCASELKSHFDELL